MTADVPSFLAGRPAGPRVAKRDFILSACRGRDVLDLGCVQHSWRMSLDNPRWLHRAVREVAASCTGVDYLAADVAELAARGFDVVVGDVLRDDPPGRYDVVVVGDLVEHLENPIALLRYVAKALRPGGRAVVTTPNALYLGQLWTVLARRRPELNPEHVLWFDPVTFTRLVERSPLDVVELHWLEPSWWALWDSRHRLVRKAVAPALHRLTRLVLDRRPYLNSDFGAVLALASDEGAADPATRAAEVMAYHGYPSRSQDDPTQNGA